MGMKNSGILNRIIRNTAENIDIADAPEIERFIVRFGEDVDLSYLPKINPVDESCYEEKYQGVQENTDARYLKNPRSFIFVEDTLKDRMAGYINFFPCEEPLYRDNIGAPRPDGSVCDHIRDDDIAPEEVAEYRNDINHIFILSIAIHEDYRNSEVIKLLSDSFIAYLNKLEEEGYPITDIAGTAVSRDGQRTLSRWLFRKLRPLGDGNTVYLCDGIRLEKFLANDLYIKKHDDDLYLMLPLAENSANLRAGNYIKKCLENKEGHAEDNGEEAELRCSGPESEDGSGEYTDDEIFDKLIEGLEEYIKYECTNVVVKDLRIVRLGAFDFLHTTDDYPQCTFGDSEGAEPEEGQKYRWTTDADITENDREILLRGSDGSGELEQEIIFDDVKGYAVLTAHPRTHMFILTVYFPSYPQSVTQMLDQMSYGYLKIRDPEDPAHYIPLYEYLLQNYGLHACGEQKALIYIDRLPEDKKEFQDMLACEAVNNFEKDYRINSDEIDEISHCDRAQFENYEVYLSSRTIVYRHLDEEGAEITDTIEKLGDVADYLFIVLLTLFQNTALAKVNSKVTNLLENDGDVSIRAKLDIDREYGQTIRFWEMQNFKYLASQQEAEHIKKAFRSEELKETYKEHQEYLEHVVEVKNAIADQRNGLIIDVVAVILALIQVKEFLVEVAGDFYDYFGIEVKNAPDVTFNYVVFGGVVLFIIILRILRRRTSVSQHKQLR